MPRALPLWVQLLLTFVGLLIGMTAVLTTLAYTTLFANLETEARRNVSLAARTREQTLTQIFQFRQQRADVFLASLQSWCTESLDSGRLAWVDDCVRPMLDDFRRSERALGAVLTYRNRVLRRSGRRVSGEAARFRGLPRVIRTADGDVEYVMTAVARQTTLALQFDHAAVAQLFDDQSGYGRSAEVVLVDYDGRFLAPPRLEGSTLPDDRAAEFLKHCRSGAEPFVDVDYRGVRTFQSFRPLHALGSACIAASLDYEKAVAPAERLREALLVRGIWFVFVGAILMLAVAHWIAAPVRRLAASARRLQTGRFDRPIPLAGPSEVRALGRAFNAMGNDLAELVAKEQAARREAEDANRAKDEFLATVSHELRTPLTAILGWAQMLLSQRLPAERVHHGIVVIERSARAQKQLIDDLLDVSRIVANRLRIVREPVRLAEVVEKALDAIRPEAVAKQVEMDTVLTESALVLGDARRLEQIVWNLVWNAVKFTQSAGRVTVRLTRVDKELVLTVTDTGVGISSAFLPYVFDWFKQADARSRSQSGLGLGLGIVRHLVQLHGGNVRAESGGLGQGATFIVTLPIHESVSPIPVPPQQQGEPAPSPTAHSLNAVRVLVVEDDADTRELVRATLESAGASVDVVASANDARREISAEQPDVLISDIRMPAEDGYSLIRSLRGAGIVTPAIALTAYARREDADEAHAAGFQVHLAKPIDPRRLVDAVAKLLRSQSVH